MRQVMLYPGESGYWVAECPSLPGCISQGKTKEDAIHNIREAIEGYILALQEDGLTVPPDNFDAVLDRKSTRLNSSHLVISYAVFCLKKKTKYKNTALSTH